MYCQSCGAEIQPGLNYCNRCGASVVTAAVREVPVPVDISTPVRWIASSFCLMFLAGLAIIFTALSGLLSWGMSRDAVMFIAFFSFMTLLVTELSIIRLLSRLLGVSKERGLLAPLGRSKAKEMHPAAQQFIQPPASPYASSAPSVTEHTTRTFTSAYREPRAGS